MQEQWFIQNIKRRLPEFTSLQVRMQFLYASRERFLRLFSGTDVNRVLALIDNLIQQTKFEQLAVIPVPKAQYPEKWFALLHAIKIGLGKENQFTDNSKEGIMKYAVNKYNLKSTGRVFYNTFRVIDLNNIVATVRSLSEDARSTKERAKWKVIITDISGNDVDIISWLKKQPN